MRMGGVNDTVDRPTARGEELGNTGRVPFATIPNRPVPLANDPSDLIEPAGGQKDRVLASFAIEFQQIDATAFVDQCIQSGRRHSKATRSK